VLDILEKALSASKTGPKDLVQLRGQKRLMTTCKVKNRVVEEFSSISLSGVGARVYAGNQSWGFSSTSNVESQAIKQTLETALTFAKASSKLRKKETKLEPIRGRSADLSVAVKKRPRDIPIEDIAAFPLSVCEGARDVGKNVAEAKSTFLSIEDDRYFLSSEGTRIHQSITRVMLFTDVIAKSAGAICPTSASLGHAGGLEIFDKEPPITLGRNIADKAVRLLDAKSPPAGKFKIIVHPTLCATLLHEAIGHPLEADLAMSGGGFGGQMNKLVSSKLITIFDDGNVRGGLGQFGFDDEGVECKHTVLIDKGVLKSFMHDRTSASVSGVKPTGNAHAWDYSVEPLIRQTNIGIEAGDWSQEEMIEDVKEGLFLEGTFGGQADANADFTFGFQSARWIENGELAEELRGANVGGNAIEVFKTADAVGKEVVLRPGACGKFQFAVQGRVVPAVRCEMLVGGTGGH